MGEYYQQLNSQISWTTSPKKCNREKGVVKIEQKTSTGCLLWVGDVAHIRENKEELQEIQLMLNITDEIAKLKFGKDKAKHSHQEKGKTRCI